MESLCSRAMHAFVLVLQMGDRVWIQDLQFKREDIDHFLYEAILTYNRISQSENHDETTHAIGFMDITS